MFIRIVTAAFALSLTSGRLSGFAAERKAGRHWKNRRSSRHPSLVDPSLVRIEDGRRPWNRSAR